MMPHDPNASEATMTSLTARRGGALAMVILLITVMTIALAAAYTLNGTEVQTGDDYSEQVAALALAESGRNRFLVDRAGLGFRRARSRHHSLSRR